METGPRFEQLKEYFREQADQPFGDAELASGRTLAPFSRAGQAAATNLLTKAERALTEGDSQRAASFIERAVALGYDRHERSASAAMAVHMMLFNAVTDTLEGSAHDDSRWLDAALEALALVDGWGRSETGHALRAIRQDCNIEPAESRAIEYALSDVADRVELRDLPEGSEELGPGVRSTLQILQAYRGALAATEG